MSLENASYIHQLNPSNPSGADRLKDGDDHIRMIKSVLKNTFPGITGPLSSSVTSELLNGLELLLFKPGFIVLFTGEEDEVPTGWAICDGRQATKSDGSTTFTTPDFTDCVPSGVSSTHKLLQKYGQSSKTVTSAGGGAHAHTAASGASGAHTHGGNTGTTVLSVDQLPAHSHFVASTGTGDNATSVGSSTSVAQEKSSGGDSGYRLIASNSDPTIGKSSVAGKSSGHAHSIAQEGAHSHTVAVDSVSDHAHGVTVDVTQPTLPVYFIMKL